MAGPRLSAMSERAAIDRSGDIDWGRISANHALYRRGSSPSFFDRLAAPGVDRLFE